VPKISSPVLVLLAVIIGKIVGNCLTTGSGMSAGFTGPAALAGLAGGALVATVIGIPPGSAGYVVLLSAGFSGMIASTMNTPLASAILAVELFGTGYGLPGALSAMIAFQVARYSTIYDVALAKRPIS
jgi:H+/Cl- antiporter ClcA